MLTLNWPTRSAYVGRLFSSHDFRIEVEVLDLNEKPVASATLLEGQIDIVAPDETGVRRTASLTLLDTEHALDFGIAAAWSGTSLWVNRLVKVTHVLRVGSTDVECPCFVGVPQTMARSGAEVDVTLADKAALANRGAKPASYAKGADAIASIRAIMADGTGETRFRFPASTGRRLSKAYSVGLTPESSPMRVARKIASAELGMQLIYAADGALLLRPLPSAPSLTIPFVTAPPDTSADLSELVNFVRVTGKAQTKGTGSQAIKTQPQADASLPKANPSSPESLARNGVNRLLPLLVSDDALTSTADVKARAIRELKDDARAKIDQSFNTIPFFHADADDLVRLNIDGPDQVTRITTASIPLGVASDMTIGRNVLSRKPPRVRSQVRKLQFRRASQRVKGKTVTTWKRF